MNNLTSTLSLTPIEVPLPALVINIFLAAIFSLILSRFYVYFGRSLSNRSRLANNFLLISVTTALVITIVKSSLALSLGLVGALSIVRFRAAIKEPEELAYLFLSISVGLGFGAEQRMVTVVAFITILFIIYAQHLIGGKLQKENLFLTLSLKKSSKKNIIENILECISKHSIQVDLRRVDDNKNQLQIGLMIELESSKSLQKLLGELRKKYPSIQVSLVDSSGIVP